MADAGFWVFGYGSLIWNPGFDYLERRRARLAGYRRAFKLRSIRYRGTAENPGLVLGLDWDPNARCDGMAFRVCPTRDGEVRDYLRAREMVTMSYFEVQYPVRLIGEDGTEGESVEAICYVLDRTHPQYAGPIGLDEQAEIIARAVGPKGPNCDYLHSTAESLEALGLDDPDLRELDRKVRRLTVRHGPSARPA